MTESPSQTIGPFFHIELAGDHALGIMAAPNAQGEQIELSIGILDGNGTPVPDALVELWQADAQGKYAHPEDTKSKTSDRAFRGFGRLATNENGVCVFNTVKPGRVPGLDGALQAPHINVSVFARGILARLVTRIYFARDPANDDDAILALTPPDRRQTLLAHSDSQSAWQIDIHLCGDRETVFFDL
jgi:protocatechuate 3,4-dioxygenase alpha subunit